MASIRTAGLTKDYGWMSVAFGIAGAAAALALLVDVSEIAAVVIFALIGFHVAVGWKVLRLSNRRAVGGDS